MQNWDKLPLNENWPPLSILRTLKKSEGERERNSQNLRMKYQVHTLLFHLALSFKLIRTIEKQN